MRHPELSRAWDRMFRLRTCPPPSILRLGGEPAERHLASCRICREILADLAGMEEAIPARHVMPPPPSVPEPGDIRRIRPADGPERWFDEDGAYRNPPLVLVLTEPDAAGAVRVSQIFNEPALSFMGDIPLEGGRRGFAEAWNIYGCPVSGLTPHPFRRVDPDLAREVLRAPHEDSSSADETSPLHWFRRCERDVAEFFRARLADADLPHARIIPFASIPGIRPKMPDAGRCEAVRRLLEGGPASGAGGAAYGAVAGLCAPGIFLGAVAGSIGGLVGAMTRLAELRHGRMASARKAAEAPAAESPREAGESPDRLPFSLGRMDADGNVAPIRPDSADGHMAELVIRAEGDGHRVTALCRVPEAAVADAILLRGEERPEEMACSWRRRDLLRVSALFPHPAPKPGELRLAVLLSDGERDG